MTVPSLATQIAARFGGDFARPEMLRLLWLIPVVWLAGLLVRGRTAGLRLAAALILRSIVLALVVFALSGMGRKKNEERLPAVIAAVDVSDSMGEEGRAWSRERARELLESTGPGTSKAVISFADGSRMSAPPATAVGDAMFSGEVPTGETDIAEAIGTALAAFPRDGPKRLLLLSDGNETEGDALGMAELVARDGIRIDCFPPPETEVTGAVLKRLDVPEEVSVEEKFAFRVLVENRGKGETRSGLTIREGDDLIKRWTVALHPGTNAFEVPYSIASPGVHRISAVLGPEGAIPGVGMGREVSSPLLVVGRPKVLCLSGTADGKNFLTEAVSARDIETTVGGVELLPGDLDGLLEYDCVILSNVPRATLTEAQAALLERYVRDHGGGLLMLGSSASFGPGGYRGSAIEKALPVVSEKDVPFTKDKVVRLCIILVIDESGSMAMPRRKIVAARRSAEELVKQLKPNDMVGIISFDDRNKVRVPLELVGDRKEFIIDRIRLIHPKGGTVISTPLKEALKQMRAASGKIKHVILLTDGKTDKGDLVNFPYGRLIQAFRQSDVSISTVGIGGDADGEFLTAIARGSGGQYYYVKDPTTLPIIVIEDTKKVLDKSGFSEKPFLPKFGDRSRMLEGISPGQVPRILGHAVTRAKPRAAVALYTDVRRVRDPVLAGWRYGLGKAVAFTSDAEARWSKEMVGWRMFAKFWGQVLRWAMRERSGNYYLVSLGEERGARYVELSDFSAVPGGASFRIVLPRGGNGGDRAVKLHQVAPHTYRGDGKGVSPFDTSVLVEKLENGRVVDRKEVPLVRRERAVAATDETAATGNNVELLRRIAAATGGGLSPEAGELRVNAEVVPVTTSLLPWILPLIFFLLLADIAVRKWAR